MWVVKLGGSLLAAGNLKEWLSVIVKYGAGKLVIVPGGGIFADQVRDAQHKWKFDDTAAHQMALLAMEQYAHLLQSYAPQLSLADSTEEIEQMISQNQIPVCLPFKMTKQCQELSANWNLTSDSLSLWLAGRLNAEHTMLLKSISVSQLSDRGGNAGDFNARQLSDAGMVDKDFPKFAKTSKSIIWWLAQNDMGTLEKILKTNEKPENHLKCLVY